MLQIAEFDPIASAAGTPYRPRVYGDATTMHWDGYVVFFAIGGGSVISTPRETTQPSVDSLRHWALALDAIYLEGALGRALAVSSGVPMPTTVTEFDLAATELTAAGDAIALHRAADRAGVEAASELAAAEMHEQAAALARENADRLGRTQEDLDTLADQSTRRAAEATADAYESGAREARSVAAKLGSPGKKSRAGASAKRFDAGEEEAQMRRRAARWSFPVTPPMVIVSDILGKSLSYAVTRDESRPPCAPARILASHLALTLGARLGIYEIIASIGVGGMGEVYRATDTTLGRQVARTRSNASLFGEPFGVSMTTITQSSSKGCQPVE